MLLLYLLLELAVLHLLEEEDLRSLVYFPKPLEPTLGLFALHEFSLLLPSADLHVFICRLGILLFDDCVGHVVHEHLLSVFTSMDFPHAVLFLLLEHFRIRSLCLDVL